MPIRYPLRFSSRDGAKGFTAKDIEQLRNHARERLGLSSGFVAMAHSLDLIQFFERRGYILEES